MRPVPPRSSSPVYFEGIRLAHAFFNCDVFINVPTLKTHHLAGLTVALKNLYGCLPREDKSMYHRIDRVEEAIVDMNIVRPSNLIVVDGTYSTHHIPPFEKHELNLALAGSDPLAVDAVAAKVIGVDPKTLRYLTWATDLVFNVRAILVEAKAIPPGRWMRVKKVMGNEISISKSRTISQ